MRRLAGLDINGRADFAARDWHIDGSKVEEQGDIEIVAGGASSVTVRMMDEEGKARERWIGGPQATLAPHGRGQGWGTIGCSLRRRSVAAAWDDPKSEDSATTLAAACDALARGTEQVVVAVPDLPNFDERRRGQLLSAFSRPRLQASLVWRSVAAFHGLQWRGVIKGLEIGQRVRLLVHGASGLEQQDLILRNDSTHPDHSAPLREGPGQLVCADLGLDTLLARAQGIVREANPQIDWERTEPSRLPGRLLTGDAAPGEVEVLRYWNGNWVAVTAPELSPSALGIQADARGEMFDDAPAFIVLVTPLAQPLAQALGHPLGGEDRLLVADGHVIACGALRSGRLIEQGRPHYFDRLTPIEIAVLRGGEPTFEYLIKPDEVVPADREYRSPELGGFELRRGQQRIEFYVVKDGDEIRHWTVELMRAPPRNVPVVLRLRQTPGQSWADLTVTSPEWEPLARSPHALRWETLAPLKMTREEVLKRLSRPPPPIPERIIERSHIDLWRGADWAGRGALEILRRSEHLPPAALAQMWAEVLSRPRRHPATRERFWCMGTDGDLPPQLPEGARHRIDQVIEAVAGLVLEAITSRRPLPNNAALRLVTWCFVRCPEPVKDAILEALEAHATGREHCLLRTPHALRVLRQGAGRCITGQERLERLFCYYAKAGDNNDVVNGLAMALTRRAEAPDALVRGLVDRFLAMLGTKLVRCVDDDNLEVAFRNTLSAIAGLFRWRRHEPRAFLAASDPLAQQLRGTVVTARDRLRRGGQSWALALREQRAIELMNKIVEYLDGAGDPDILRQIEDD